ncbi:MAG: hypothetical protein JNM63_15370, partial [Spirochaetia bacterium]|nr:hypothetical protein [Spirochaetia bacterium]
MIIALVLLLTFTWVFAAEAPVKILLDEDNTFTAWKAFGQNTDPAFVKTGKVSAVWKGVGGRAFSSRTFAADEDWSSYNTFSFWAWSGSANGAIFALNINASNTHVGDSYFKLIAVDWSGWKKFEIPFSAFSKNRNPTGWSRVNGLTLMSEGMGAQSKS